MGYVLPFGQMSFWGATVITNLLSPFPSLIEWVSGGHYVYNPTLKRFFLFHFQFPFLLCGFRILHLFYLHFLSSNNPLRNSTNNKIPFFPFIFLKDFFGFILILCLYLLQTHFGISLSFRTPAVIILVRQEMERKEQAELKVSCINSAQPSSSGYNLDFQIHYGC